MTTPCRLHGVVGDRSAHPPCVHCQLAAARREIERLRRALAGQNLPTCGKALSTYRTPEMQQAIRDRCEERRPPPPESLVGALQDPVHTGTGVYRAARAHRQARREAEADPHEGAVSLADAALARLGEPKP